MQSIHTVLTRRFFRQALIPIFFIELSLIITLFGLNHYQSVNNKKALASITQESFNEIVAQTSDVITSRFAYDKASLYQIAETTTTLFRHAEDFPIDPNAWHYRNGFFQLNLNGKDSSGFYRLPASKETAVYTTNLTTLSRDDYRTLTALSLLVPSVQAVVERQNDLISAAWINIDKRFALAYPPICPNDELQPKLDVTQYSFYYLADPEHNPSGDAVFIPLHLEQWAIDAGELGAYLMPLYRDHRFIGVIGLTLTGDAVADVIREMDLPFNAYAMLVDSKDHLIVSSDPDAAHDAFGVDSFYELTKHPKARSGKTMKLNRSSIDMNRTVLIEEPIPGTDLKLLISAEKAEIFDTVNRVSSRTVYVGYGFIAGITLFYIFFFLWNDRSMKRFALMIASPLQAIVSFSSKLGRQEDIALEPSDIDEFQELNSNLNKTHEKLLEMLIKDPQTGLYNRNKLLQDLEEISEATLMRLQLRNYHTLSNLYGQEAADTMVHSLVEHLKMYRQITLYRSADDEFTLLDTEGDADIFHSMFQELLQLHVSYYEVDLHPLLFAGIALKTPLFNEAGIALLEAQRTNAAHPVTSDETAQTKESFDNNIAWSSRFNHALSEGRLIPYFQPIYNLETRKIEKFESLVRMIEGDNVIPPYHFLQAAADMGKTHEVTRLMIRSVVTVAARFSDIGFTINIAFKDFDEINLPEYLGECCRVLGVPPKQITLELLETEPLDESERIIQAITRLKHNGFNIAIDDFGTGHSNFAHLMRMQVDYIKIDGNFVKNIAKDPHSATITRTIAQFAGLVGAKTVAEFVADEQILKRVRQFGIDYAQGYVISPPVAESKLEALLQQPLSL
jgi:EAL domain-containing protein (putative c-di-GMP-specific phosphodiesterase class I)/GGDEF domain-containing protein